MVSIDNLWPKFLIWPTNKVLQKLKKMFHLSKLKEISSKNKINGILLPKLLWPIVRKIVLVIEKNFWNSRLKAENLQNFWDHQNNSFEQWKVRLIVILSRSKNWGILFLFPLKVCTSFNSKSAFGTIWQNVK